jgi:hypothetical protein
MKLVLAAVVVVAALAGIAGAVIFGGNRAEEQVASAQPVQGSSFSDAPSPGNAAPSAPAVQQPAAPGNAEAPAASSVANAPGDIKPATAADIPADISKIPSATPVPQPEVGVAGGSPAPALQPAASAPVASGDYKDISFQLLAGYKYVEPVPQEGAKPEQTEALRKKNQIPADVMALNGSKAAVEGWMVPMQVDDNGGVKSFVLVKTQPQCCFGDTQKMNEWIDVSMPAGQTAEFNVDRPVKVYGKLEVGEKTEDGFVLSVYRMQAEKVSG